MIVPVGDLSSAREADREQLGCLKTSTMPLDIELNSQTFTTDLQAGVTRQVIAAFICRFQITPVPKYHLGDFQPHNEQLNTMH